MSLRKLISWPGSLNVTVHVRRLDELLLNSAIPLSDAEVRRAARIRSLSQRHAFVACRRLARQVLAALLDCPPEAVPIVVGPKGSLALRGKIIQFNLSHSGDWCALAWSAGHAVGVDVEVIRPVPDMADIVINFFPPVARRAFLDARSENQREVFFRWWTRIEAALKASGQGLDDSYVSFRQVALAACEAVPTVALAVAVVGKGPLTATWHLPRHCAVQRDAG